MPQNLDDLSFLSQDPEPVTSQPAPAQYRQLQDATTAELMSIPGVEAVWLQLPPIGAETIIVGVRSSDIARKLPASREGLPIEVRVTGGITAY
jgi:hypothetical protein